MEPIRILLVEDQTLMRQGLKTILDLEPGLQVVGEASDGEAGVQAALELRPDVILMDVQLPKLNGVEATAAICAAWPPARVIILTTFDRDDYVFRGVRAGAVGYLLKDAPATHLIDTIRRVHAGEVFIQPAIASRLLRELVRPRNRPSMPCLSANERCWCCWRRAPLTATSPRSCTSPRAPSRTTFRTSWPSCRPRIAPAPPTSPAAMA
jgi:DNA-binding NarL/FixJ family response regulator